MNPKLKSVCVCFLMETRTSKQICSQNRVESVDTVGKNVKINLLEEVLILFKYICLLSYTCDI